ncbi:MAG: 2'-5' RNA ligase family protein [Pseudomonadota bacterium]
MVYGNTPTQGTFEFFQELPVRPKRPERLVFMLFPDTETSVHIERIGQKFVCQNHLTGTPLRPERLHISLHHVRDDRCLRTKFIYAAVKAAEAVSIRSFEVAFRFITSFESGRPHRRPLVLLGEGDAMFDLHGDLGAAMVKNGLKAAGQFTPHMTLFYGPKAISTQSIEPIRFMVHELVLIHSELGLGRYSVLGRWSLNG